MNQMKIKKLTPTAHIPTTATDGSAGYDLYTDGIRCDGFSIPPHTTILVNTGIALEIPEGLFGAIYPRSGTASKRGLRLANCVGVVDSDYRGEVRIPIHNDTDSPKFVEDGERIAQIIFQPYTKFELVETDELSNTQRGIGGFGSTGKN